MKNNEKKPSGMAVEPRSLRGPVHASIVQLAAVLGRSLRVVRAMIAEGLPAAIPGHGNIPAVYDVAEVCAWVRARDRKLKPQSEALERLRTAKAEAEERRNRIADGEFIEVATVNAYIDQASAGLQQALRTIAATWPEAGEAYKDQIEIFYDNFRLVLPRKNAPQENVA